MIKKTKRFYKTLMKKYIYLNDKLEIIKNTNKIEYIELKKELDIIINQMIEFEENYNLPIF